MNASRTALRRAVAARSAHSLRITQRQWIRHASTNPEAQDEGRRRGGGGFIKFAGVFAVAAGAAYYFPTIKSQFTDEPAEESAETPKAEVTFEKARKEVFSKEEYRDLLSSQHLQVKQSWENPGVYAWGSNSGKVIDPDSNEKYVKLPRRLAFFDGQLLRDLKLSQDFGAAIAENGDLIQWGVGYSKAEPKPVATLKGKNLVKLQVSTDRIIALSKSGQTYSVPSAKDDLEGGAKPGEKSDSWSLWSSSSSSINYRDLTPTGLKRGEKITDIASGLEHCLMLTSKGRVFSAASSATEFPSKGQMGIPGLSWATRAPGSYDQSYEITALTGFDAKGIAAGDYHSVVLDKLGRVFSFGDNTYGQLGLDGTSNVATVDSPAMLSINKLYANSGLVPRATSISAGGLNTFFSVDAEALEGNSNLKAVAPAKRMPKVTSDLWAAGQGVFGSLGTGKWTHVTLGPNKIKALSSLFEFNENANKMMPIKIKSLSVGTTHCSAIMDNVTETNISGRSSKNETNWGADVLFWGGNEHYQLGTGKRNNLNAPSYIGPLDGGEGDADMGRKGETHRLCITPRQTVRIGEGGKGRKVTLEQKVECGRYVTGVYSAV